MRPDIPPGLIWIQIVCKDYQQMAKVVTGRQRVIFLFHSKVLIVRYENNNMKSGNIQKCHNHRRNRPTHGTTRKSRHINPRGTLIFASYVGVDPASTVNPKNIRNIRHSPKIFEILATPIKYSHSAH